MDLESVLLIFLSIGFVSALMLLIFPKVNHFAKAILVSFISSLWICISIIFLAANFTYMLEEPTGFLVFIAAIGGIGISIITGSLMMIFLIKNNKLRDRSQ